MSIVSFLKFIFTFISFFNICSPPRNSQNYFITMFTENLSILAINQLRREIVTFKL